MKYIVSLLLIIMLAACGGGGGSSSNVSGVVPSTPAPTQTPDAVLPVSLDCGPQGGCAIPATPGFCCTLSIKIPWETADPDFWVGVSIYTYAPCQTESACRSYYDVPAYPAPHRTIFYVEMITQTNPPIGGTWVYDATFAQQPTTQLYVASFANGTWSNPRPVTSATSTTAQWTDTGNGPPALAEVLYY